MTAIKVSDEARENEERGNEERENEESKTKESTTHSHLHRRDQLAVLGRAVGEHLAQLAKLFVQAAFLLQRKVNGEARE